jgi:pimeloyl-ACP methyl ester carboxylesterase
MARRMFLRSLVLAQFAIGTAHGQVAAGALPFDSVSAEYRKLDALATFVRNRNSANYAITAKNGIDEGSFVSIGGIEQWITIRGQDRHNPVLLFLHGGPGDVTNPWSFALFAPWESEFTIVQWDERGAGRTLRRNGPSIASTITLDRMVQDGVELSEYLRKHLGKERIIIVGHSFGSILGVMMARARPELFAAYVGTGQVADGSRNYAVAYDALLKKARTMNNVEAIADLERVGPPPYKSGEGFGIQRKWSNRFEGADEFIFGTIGLTLVAPGSSVRDLNDSGDGQQLSAERLVPQTAGLKPKDLGLEFSIPVFVFQGAEDFTTPTALAREYVASLKAPTREFVPIAGGGHFAVFMRSGQFLGELVKRVRPLALDR